MKQHEVKTEESESLEKQTLPAPASITLSTLAHPGLFIITEIDPTHSSSARLQELGLMPGAAIEVIRPGTDPLIRSGGATYAINRQISSAISGFIV